MEVQSERFHRGLVPEEVDRERIARLELAGFEVLEVVEEDLFHHPEEVIARVDDARGRAARRQAA